MRLRLCKGYIGNVKFCGIAYIQIGVAQDTLSQARAPGIEKTVIDNTLYGGIIYQTPAGQTNQRNCIPSILCWMFRTHIAAKITDTLFGSGCRWFKSAFLHLNSKVKT